MTFRRSKILKAAAVVCAGAVALAACSSSGDDSDDSTAASGGPAGTGTPATGSTVKVGFIYQSAASSLDDQTPGNDAFNAWIKATNANGGLAGHRVSGVSCPQTATPESLTQCATKMADEKVVSVLAIGLGDYSQLIRVTKPAKIPLYSGTLDGSALTSGNAFALDAATIPNQAGVAQWAKDNDVKSVSYIVINFPGADSLEAAAKKYFTAVGISFKSSRTPPQTPDATGAMTAATSSKPDAVFVLADPTTCVSFMKAKQLVNYQGKMITGSACAAPSVAPAAGSAAGDVYVVRGTSVTSDSPDVKAYRDLMKQYAPKADADDSQAQILYAVATGYAGIVNKGITAGGPLTGAAVLAATKKAKDIPVPLTGGAKATCDGSTYPGQPAFCVKASVLDQYDSSGKLKYVATVNPTDSLK